MILGADWVLPMDGPPVRDGAVRIEDGVIAEVSDRLQPDRRFADAVILPGLVNAHTHLEYGSMSAMGDGLPFSPWIEQLIVRKSGLVRDDYLAQSHAGVHACLAGGVPRSPTARTQTPSPGGDRAGPARDRLPGEFSDQGDPPADAGPLTRFRRRPVTPASRPTPLHRDRQHCSLIELPERGIPVATHLLESSGTPSRSISSRACSGRTPSPSTCAGLAATSICSPGSTCRWCTAPAPTLCSDAARALPELLRGCDRPGTDSPASALAFDMWDEMRACPARPRPGGPAGRADGRAAL